MMADEEGVSSAAEDILQGTEPGACRSSMLVTTDSFEDIEQYLEDTSPELGLTGLVENTVFQSVKANDVSQECGSAAAENSPKEPDSIERLTADTKADEHNTDDKKGSMVTNTNCTDTSLTTTDDNLLHDFSNIQLQSKETVSVTTQQEQYVAQDEPRHPTPDEPEEIDYVHSQEWKMLKKHIFILSQAGKPIYSRYGDEDRLVTLTGVTQALVSFITERKDLVRCIVAGDHRFVFLVREHLILVAVSRSGESMHHLLLQLSYIYNQILSILTLSQLSRIFEQRGNYDLRRLLTGAEKFLDNLMNLMDHDPSFFLSAVRCLPLDSSVRDQIATSIAQNAKVKDLVFAILVADNQLVTLVRLKKYFLHPVDLHLIFNLVSASESFKTAESWTPICLPKFDSGGYLHAHISYLDEDCQSCLLLLTVDRDVFFTLAECKKKIQEKLQKHNCLRAISESIRTKSYKTGEVGIPELRHFLYKSRSTAQFTSPEYEAPYADKDDQSRLFGLYQYLHHRIHSATRPLKILFHVGASETLLGWVTSGFELYAVFSPLVTKHVAINSVNKLLKWIKKEEDGLFILSSPTF